MPTTPGTPTRRPTRRRTAQRDSAAPAALLEDTQVANQARYVMIQQAAYLRAERRGFEPGGELEDWLAAEKEIDALLGAASGSTHQ